MSDAGDYYTLGNTDSLRSKAEEAIESERDTGKVMDWSVEKKLGSSSGTAEFVVGDNYVIMAADESTGICVRDGSIIMAGKVHLTKSPSDIRINGFWVLNEELLTTIPSTLFCPVQTLIYKAPPYAKKVGKFAKLMTSFAV